MLEMLLREDFVLKRKEANASFFKANPSPKFKALKVAYTIEKIQNCQIARLIEEKSSSLSCILLYGSAARGEDGPESDYDFLVIAQDCWATPQELSSRLKKEVSIKSFSISKWKSISKNNRAFYLEAIANSIAPKGEKPVID